MVRSIRRSLLFPSLVAVALLVTQLARAQAPEAEARKLFQEGVAAADAERWADAADRFSRSRALVERPSTVHNLVGALYRLGRYPDALKAADDYLRISDPQADAAQRTEVARLAGEMKRTVARVDVSVDPGRAIVELDGARQAPVKPGVYQLTLNPGSYLLTARADGYDPHQEKLDLGRGGRLKLRVALRSLAPVADLPAAAPGEEPVSKAAPPRRSSTDALLEEGPGTDLLNRAMTRKVRRKRALWVVGGVLVAGAITGAVIAGTR